MTEVTDQLANEDRPAPPQVSAGTLLRQARESAGVHIASLAVSLKVPVSKLEALEADQYDLLLDAVFVRALAASVCRTLGVESAEVLQRLPKHDGSRLGERHALRREPYAMSRSSSSPLAWSTLSRPAVIGGLALVVGAALLVFLPPFDFQSLKAGQVDGVTEDSGVSSIALPLLSVPEADASVVQGVSSGTVANLTTPAESLEVPSAGLSVPSGPASALTPALIATGTVKPVVTSPAASAVLPPTLENQIGKVSRTGVVVFKPSAESWVEVRDATGTIVLRRRLAPAEVVGATGTLPLNVIVGRADATQVQVRGVPLDLVPLARDNVARFEVK